MKEGCINVFLPEFFVTCENFDNGVKSSLATLIGVVKAMLLFEIFRNKKKQKLKAKKSKPSEGKKRLQ